MPGLSAFGQDCVPLLFVPPPGRRQETRWHASNSVWTERMIALTGAVVWAACRPVLKLVLVMGIGFALSRKRILDEGGSKVLAKMLIWVLASAALRWPMQTHSVSCPFQILNPSLMFANVVSGTDLNHLREFGIMNLAAVAHILAGCALGGSVLVLTRPPAGFRYGSVLAVAMTNCGDVALAVVLSLGNAPPFAQGDATLGVVYVSAYLVTANLFFFSVGYACFGLDVKALRPPSAQADKASRSTPPLLRGNINDGLGSVAVLNTLIYDTLDGAGEDSLDATANELPTGAMESKDPRTSSSGPPTTPRVAWREPSSEGSQTARLAGWKRGLAFVLKVKFVVTSLLSPANMATILALIIASSSTLKGILYTSNTAAPEPPLKFLFETFQFLGNAAVPLGLINLGAALGRLSVASFLPAPIILSICLCRLVLMPVIGIALAEGLVAWGIIPQDAMMLRWKHVCPQPRQPCTLLKCGIQRGMQVPLRA
ncbi:membrane transport protein-domain-containing protein [Chytriomyces sp. MP71]|nr:membrane transport protein-domain-containing protein [Chytriomyces sp. MP71]